MARGKMFQVRLSEEELSIAEAGARDGGYESVSSFIRACIRQGAAPLGWSGVPMRESVSTVEPPRDVDPAECPQRVRHRKGVYCKHCGATP